ncbi:MAG: patatin-like phospholipase family protein [Leptospira sp.]|nr:patatin-like phospholipase family protein [Leptospira sp.]
MFPVERLTFELFEKFYPLEAALGIAGGGCKAFYGLGVGLELKKWGVRLKELSGVSAGSAMALCLVSNAEEEAVEFFEEITRRNDSNFKISNLFFGEKVFPHESMYRRTIRYAMDWNRIKNTDFKVFIQAVKAIPKKEESIKSKFEIAKLIAETAQAFTRDERDKNAGIPCNRIQDVLKKWNMTDVIFTEKDFESPDILEQIIMNSSSIPPVVSLQNAKNEYYLDGGLTNNLVLEYFNERIPKIGIYYEDTTLIGKKPEILNETYLMKPSIPLPITSFDYTNPQGVRETFELGKKDAIDQKDKILTFLRQKLYLNFPQFFKIKF